MQNIPGIAAEKVNEQIKTVSYSSVKKEDQQQLFSELFDQHSSRIENELALTPVTSDEKMLDVVSETIAEPASTSSSTASTSSVATHTEDNNSVHKSAEQSAKVKEQHGKDEKMTQEDLDEVRDDLKEYGFSEEEISEIEDKVNSEDGMTWGEFVSTLAHKMKEMRKVSLSDDQVAQLENFFAKFGFSSDESAKLIKQLENGNQKEVMAALQKKLDAMPDGKQLMLTKDEVEAFSAAMNFSKEFTSKIKEALGQNVLPKEIKEAFTLIRQELADMDEKDRNLVRSVSKAFVKAMGDESKETTAAKDIGEAVDLKPRVGEDAPREQPKEELKDAVDNRKDSLPANNARKTEQKAMPEQAQADMADQDASESDDTWNDFFGKLRDDSSQAAANKLGGKTENTESLLKAGLTDSISKNASKTMEKISAPKVMRQVENAVIKNMANGGKQLTLQLTPEDLGKLNILLQVNGKEVSASIRAENADAARLIADNIDMIRHSLESQGLKVDKLDVQTGLANNQSYNDWFGQNEHNLSREREAMVAMRKHMQQMRENGSALAQDMQSVGRQAMVADQGLHIIA
ncbi:flagellar hook-length control protein FliK [Pseudodesulfovibrio cashew]|uniref:Flagellar hook-length control protein FliK n=1 Tax=Pseudodesulfovibrio cashew TaxID=2678688 RepID=A0A6I6JEQ6_9BACT|nr:flagellar hook-length control protein FliK [Pseudodesulfovibrio cashew]QGY39083.1 flagellar hook-length control protein FliK [Pseudodesulfovibrio cashew]